MKLYLDLCVFNRPFDYQGQDRVSLETEAFIYLIDQIEKGRYSLLCSEILVYENDNNPDDLRRDRVQSYFELAKDFVSLEESDFERAENIKTLGFSDMDALHIAAAEKGDATSFITCDDGIVNLYRKNSSGIKVEVKNLMEFVTGEVK